MEESSTVIPREIAKNKEIIPPPRKKILFFLKLKLEMREWGEDFLGRSR